MKELTLSSNDKRVLDSILSSLEEQFGTEYAFTLEKNIYSCKCSGPAQSCAWH